MMPMRSSVTVHSLLAALLTGAMAAVAAGCGDSSRAAGTPPAPVVKVESVVEKDVPISAEWVGTLVGSINAQIRARVSGHLVSQNYKEGSLVKSGDFLFQVDSRPFQAAVEQAEARLQQAQSQLSQAKAQVSASQAQVEQVLAKVVEDEAQVKRAEATQRLTEIDVGRYTPLVQGGFVSKQDLDHAVQTNLANLAAVAAARAAVLNAQASVTQARAALEKSQAEPIGMPSGGRICSLFTRAREYYLRELFNLRIIGLADTERLTQQMMFVQQSRQNGTHGRRRLTMVTYRLFGIDAESNTLTQ